jgi:hypothetical protein
VRADAVPRTGLRPLGRILGRSLPVRNHRTAKPLHSPLEDAAIRPTLAYLAGTHGRQTGTRRLGVSPQVELPYAVWKTAPPGALSTTTGQGGRTS